MVSITPPPSAVIHAPTPVGSKKDQARTDLKAEIAKSSVDKKMTSDKTSEHPHPAADSETHMHIKADGTKQLITVQEGVETRQKAPVDHSDKVQKVVHLTTKTPKQSFDKTA